MSDAASLLEQFIPEARELLDQAGRSLLELERMPGAVDSINALFRAVHTLKGTSGLFDVGPLTRAVHAAEDLLDAVQAGHASLDGAMADRLLATFDQVGLWIDALDQTGHLPAGAEEVAAICVEQLRALLNVGTASATTDAAAPAACLPAWLSTLSPEEHERLRNVMASDAAWQAIRYTPDASCFFRGEDPLALLGQIEHLHLLRTELIEPWPTLEALDPFHSNLRFLAVSAASSTALAALFRYIPEQVEVVPLPAGWPDTAADSPIPVAPDDAEEIVALRGVLEAQQRLLTAPGPESSWSGRLAAAARALRSALAHAGKGSELAELEAATAAATAARQAAPLIEWVGRLLTSLSADALPSRVSPSPEQPFTLAAEARPSGPSMLRVDQGKIDALMNLIGELTVAKNALGYLARRADEGSFTVHELAREIKDRQALVSRIAEEMQSVVMAVRMLPVNHVFQRFPRLIRDIARRLGKQVELVVEGGETEADKNIIEALADPLIHMVRNSVDHGIELPAERLAAGKPAQGTIRLHASHDNDRVVIRLSDDGRGIDPAVVLRKAIEKGLVDADRAAGLSEEEALRLVFAPGFSTAAAVSDLSGRGVGMDVVRSAVEKAGGRVTLSSRLGQGTTVELTLPLSMAITRIMTVACGDRLFGVPMAIVMETVRIHRKALHRFGEREAFVLRDSVVPVLRLAHLLDLPEAGTDDVQEEEAILVVRVNDVRIGIVVGAFREGMEVIVKPLEGFLAGIPGLSGTTLMGDGRVLLILDLPELVA